MNTSDEQETQLKSNESQKESNPKILFGKYEILTPDGKEISGEKATPVGEGGMGKIWRGRDINLRREVAVKEFAPSNVHNIDEKTWAELEIAFQREATLLANLKHESMPIVFDSFSENRKQYLVMEFVEGDDLGKRAEELRDKYDGQFPIDKVRQWAKELLEILIYLHDRDSPIFHRDIKPANLKTRNGKICLLDFGLASSASEITTYGFTERYAPIEQMWGEKKTPQIDLYALAATLYYLVTGVEPLKSHHRWDTVRKGSPDPLPPVKKLRPEVDDSFARIIMQGLAIEAQNRPTSAREMLASLEAVNEPQPEQASVPTVAFSNPLPIPIPTPEPLAPVPVVDTSPKKSSRSKLIVLPILGIAVLCILGAIALAWIYFKPTPIANNNSNQPQNVAVTSKERSLLSERKLYNVPRLGSVTGKLDKGTKVKVDDERKENDGTWYDVKSGSKSGWIFCEKDESCISQ